LLTLATKKKKKKNRPTAGPLLGLNPPPQKKGDATSLIRASFASPRVFRAAIAEGVQISGPLTGPREGWRSKKEFLLAQEVKIAQDFQIVLFFL